MNYKVQFQECNDAWNSGCSVLQTEVLSEDAVESNYGMEIMKFYFQVNKMSMENQSFV